MTYRAGVSDRHNPGVLMVVDLVQALDHGRHDRVQFHVLRLG